MWSQLEKGKGGWEREGRMEWEAGNEQKELPEEVQLELSVSQGQQRKSKPYIGSEDKKR